jgi:hypothetical protein
MEIELSEIVCKLVNEDLSNLDTLLEENNSNDDTKSKEETKTESQTEPQTEPITKIELKHIIQFLKDMFPQYDEDILTIIYNYTTNLDETIIKLMDMNKEFDIEQLIDNSYKDLNSQVDSQTNTQTNFDESNGSNRSLLSSISSRLNILKVNRSVKYQLLE